MTPNQLREAAEVMFAAADGVTIEVRARASLSCAPEWHTLIGENYFNWAAFCYRIKPTTPDTIDWSHVAPDCNWVARDLDGSVSLFTSRPEPYSNHWDARQGAAADANAFASYKRGTCDWKDSLAERPVDWGAA